VEAFLKNKIGFLEMSDIIEKCLETIPFLEHPSMDDYVACDAETRKLALTLYK
jgi:1-deoxy-D-xylulose-5-phosphate reductoisomerase